MGDFLTGGFEFLFVAVGRHKAVAGEDNLKDKKDSSNNGNKSNNAGNNVFQLGNRTLGTDRLNAWPGDFIG